MNYETPCFIIDKKELQDNVKKLHKSLAKNWDNYIIGYSIKTNSLPWVINFFKNQDCYAEVVSDFEYNLAKKIGYKDDRIVFNGPNKGRLTFISAVKSNCIVNIDSWREINWLKEEKFTDEVKLGIRVNINLENECPGETSVGKEAP